MNISEAGQHMIETLEGVRLTAYQDSVGVWTIGTGHTGPEVHEGLEWTPEQAAGVLLSDLTTAENGVEAAIRKPMTQNQFDAMVSLCFNIGVHNFSHSSVVNYFNAGDVQTAADAFEMWTKAGGKTLPGLVNRRRIEKQMFLGESNA